MTVRIITVVLACMIAAGCSAKLSADLEIDGEKFVPDSCRSGAVHGFVGVEITGESGKRLRLAMTPTGEPVVILFIGESIGVKLGTCGSLNHSYQNSTINDVKNVKGDAKLDCDTDGHTVKGTLSFENCH